MTWLTIGLFCAGCALLAFCGWAVVAGGAMRQADAEADLARPKRVYIRGLCVYCGEVVVLRSDGEPHRRFHRCESSRAPWPPAFVQDESTRLVEPAQTVATWPPESKARSTD